MTPRVELGITGYVLRPWLETDAPSMVKHLGNPNVGRYMADWYPQSGYTLAHAQAWATVGHREIPSDTNWAIAWQGDGHDEAIGSAGVHPKMGFDRCNTEIGYWLSESHWGQGIGSAVVRVLTQFAFRDLEVTRVFAPIHADNATSQRICEKNGFVFEGLRRQSVMKCGKAIDTVVWAAYADSWSAR
jgi:[ribosomal protein S5]-alanine N-acetyltransferase